jgi:hypothetical protein
VLRRWLADNEVQRLLRVNRYQGVLWFNEEAFKQVLWWMMIVATVAIAADGREAAAERIAQCYCVIEELQRAGEASGYQLENLLEASRA